MVTMNFILKNVHLLAVILFLSINTVGSSDTTHDWDLLIFTQQWPISVCVNYEESFVRFNQHSCYLPKDQSSWTIHGLWPTKLHTIGPSFCNKSIIFNETLLNPILNQLLIHWPNIEADKSKSSLWEHEWLKHGSCAATLESLNSELKYFEQGLRLFQRYDMSTILRSSNLSPSNAEMQTRDIYNAVKKSTGKNPHLNCMIEKKSRKIYLLEVRICFDKGFELIDCDGIKIGRRNSFNQLTSIVMECPLNQNLIYPKELPIVVESNSYEARLEKQKYSRILMNTLRTVQFLQRLTFF